MQFLKPVLKSKVPDLLFPILLSVIAGAIFYKNYFTVLGKVEDGIIGIATYEGVDIAGRIKKYYYAAVCMAASFFFFAAGYLRLLKRSGFSIRDRAFINTLSFITLIIISATALISEQLSEIGKMFTVITAITFVFVAIKGLRNLSVRLDWNKVCLAIVVSFLSLVFLRDLLAYHGKHPEPEKNLFIIAAVYLPALLFFACVKNKFFERLFGALVPLSALPLVYIISNELYLIFLKKNISISSGFVYISLLCLLCLSAAFKFFTVKKPNIKRSVFRMGIWLVAGIVITGSYHYQITHWQIEDFEFANPANAMMNMFRFHQLPIVDFYSSHLLSEQSGGILYFLLHDYNASFDFFSYNIVINLLAYAVMYIFLHRLFRRSWPALFFVLFLPFIPSIVFPPNYFTVLLCYLAMMKYMHTHHWKYFLLLSGAILFSIVWRVDTAVIAMPAVAICLLIWAVASQQLKPLLQKAVIVVVSFLCTVATVIFILTARGHNIASNFKDALAYIGASQAHGFGEILNGNVYNLNTAYFILPVITIFLSLIAFIFYYQKKIRLNELLLIVFFSIVYCLNFQRGLVRHTVGNEGYDNFLVSVLYFLVPISVVILLRLRRMRLWLFSLFSFLFFMAFKTPTPRQSNIWIADALTEMSYRNFFTKEDANKERFEGFKEYSKKYQQLDSFMNTNFKPDASFIDLSNTPMLYYFLQRPVPGYFCQYMQNMVTASIQERNLEQLQKMDLPVTVFSSFPKHDFFDRTDNVENTVRYHKIANHIFNFYKPLGVVDGKFLWIKKDAPPLKFNNTIPLSDSIIYAPEHFNIQRLAYLWAKGKNIVQSAGIYLQRDSTEKWKLPSNIDKRKGNYILIELENRTEDQHPVNTFYASDGKALGKFDFWVSEKGIAHYLIPVSTQYNWYVSHPDHFIIHEDVEGLDVKSVSLFGDL